MQKKHALPPMEFKFTIQMDGDETKMNWVGDFVYRRPTLNERARIDVMRAKLNGDLLTIDLDTAQFNEAIAHLRFTLKEFPDWWKEADYGGGLYDMNLVLGIYAKVIEFERSWSEKVFGGKSKTVEVGNEEGAEEPPAPGV